MREVPVALGQAEVVDVRHFPGLEVRESQRLELPCPEFMGKGFQFKTLMQGSLLHEFFKITSKDHAV